LLSISQFTRPDAVPIVPAVDILNIFTVNFVPDAMVVITAPAA